MADFTTLKQTIAQRLPDNSAGEIDAYDSRQSFIDTIDEVNAKKADTTALTAHTTNVSNPHSVTKAQVGLGNVPNTDFTSRVVALEGKTKLSDFTDDLGSSPVHTHSQYLTEHQSLAEYRKAAAQDTIDNTKVDKVSGKGLSTNDYTNADKAAVAQATEDIEELTDRVDNLSALGRFLSVWNCSTGKPATDPSSLPYAYKSGDYYIIGNAGGRLMPSGSSYTGAASTTQMASDPTLNSIFRYDGTQWGYMSVAERTVTFGSLAGSPSDNTALAAALGAKQDTIADLTTIRSGAALGATAVQGAISTTYAALKGLRDAGTLKAGQFYRITDFVTTSNGGGSDTSVITDSAGHAFDVVVFALDNAHLSEEAWAAHHAGDTYFASSKLEAWELKYCIDNDTARFAWADTSNGKGVIYYMKDEFLNECPYDFKNIRFKRKWNATKGLWCDKGTASEGVFAYTFSSGGSSSTTEFTDYSLESSYDIWGNKIGASGIILNNICFFGYLCQYNTFGDKCYSNTFGDECYSNTFGNWCYSNTFGNTCDDNTFGNECINNTFGYQCEYNSFGNSCSYNTFGNSCYSNSFGNNCGPITIGNSCYDNSFGNECGEITIGNACDSNTFGNGCYIIKFSSDPTTTIGGHYFSYNTFENGASRNKLVNIGTASSANLVKNNHIKSSMKNGQEVITPVARNLSYDTTIAKNSSGVVKKYTEADLIA